MQIPCGGVAFFDSGIGGLTVMAECRKYVKNEIFYYYGDNVHAPYGNLPPEKIFSYVDSAFEKLARLQVKGVVLACNTATAVCIERLRKKYPFPIIGTEPAILPAVKNGGEVLVLSTCATQKSERFLALCREAQRRFPTAELTLSPCVSLAGEIEKNLLNPSFSYLPFLPKASPNAVVLGCTHYVYIKSQIQAFYNCPVYDGNEGVANRLVATLFQGEKAVENTFQIPAKTDEKSFLGKNCRDEQPLVTTARPPENYYLGAQKTRNKLVFEQMFAK